MPTDLTNPLRAISNPHGYDYLLSLPPDARGNASHRWPLILFLHGAAERGSNVMDVARQGLPRLLAPAAEQTPAESELGRDVAARFIVAAPQCGHYEVWDEQGVLQLLDDVSGGFNIDAARVYLTGLSMGGFGVWSAGLRHPERFAALVPVCGGGRILDVNTAMARHPAPMRRLGIWAFHGARDRVVPLEESERMVGVLRRAGKADVKLTIYADAEHDAWTPTYANPELYRWLLQHKR